MINRRHFIKTCALSLPAAHTVLGAEGQFITGAEQLVALNNKHIAPLSTDFLFARVEPEAITGFKTLLDRAKPVAVTPEAGLTFTGITNQFLLGENADWQPQDYVDSQGIKSVRVEGGRLILEARLAVGDPNFSKGEVFLDLPYFPGFECQVPIDFSRRKITAEIEVPSSLVGKVAAQVFVKDASYRSQYGEWTPIMNVKTQASLSPTTGAIPNGHTDPDFDPSRIRILGVKLQIVTGAYDGQIYINNISVDPPLTPTAAPALPSSMPQPILSPTDKIEVRPNGFYLNNRKWFMVGGNWRVVEYGLNFGALAWFPSGNGVSKHPNFVRVNLDYWRRAGVKVVRVVLLDDGRTMFDKDGNVISYDDIFRNDVRTFLDLAGRAGIKVEFVLFDFLIAGKEELLDRVWLRGRSKIITDDALRRQFKDKFLTPFLTDFKDHPALLVLDVINEPEWVVPIRDGGCWEDDINPKTKPDTPVSGQAMKTFIADCLTAIREQAPAKLTTVGASAATKHFPLIKDLNTHYFSLHHYPWMGSLRDYLNLLPPGKPWVLEEFPTRYSAGATPNSISGYLNLAFLEGGAGALLWNLSAGVDEHTFSCGEREARMQELRRWVDENAGKVYPRMMKSVSAASYVGTMLAPESIVAAFGTQMATRIEQAPPDADPGTPGIQLPNSLAGTTVKIKDSAGSERLAPLFFVSPNQVNYQVPLGTALGEATLMITSGDGSQSYETAQITAVAPGLFTANANGQGVAAGVALRVRPDGTQTTEPIARYDEAQKQFIPVPIDLGPQGDQVFLILFGSGFRFRSALSAVIVRIGGLNQQVLFAGSQGAFVGLDQLNVRLSRDLIGRGVVDVTLTVDGKEANKVQVQIK